MTNARNYQGQAKMQPAIDSTDAKAGERHWVKQLKKQLREGKEQFHMADDISGAEEEDEVIVVVKVADAEALKARRPAAYEAADLQQLELRQDSDMARASALASIQINGLPQLAPLPRKKVQAEQVYRRRVHAFVAAMDKALGADMQWNSASRLNVLINLMLEYQKKKRSRSSSFGSMSAYLKGGLLCAGEACGCLRYYQDREALLQHIRNMKHMTKKDRERMRDVAKYVVGGRLTRDKLQPRLLKFNLTGNKAKQYSL